MGGGGGQDEKKIIGGGVCQILKNMGGLGTWQKNIGCRVSRGSGRSQDTAIKCCTGVSKKPKKSRRLQISVNEI